VIYLQSVRVKARERPGGGYPFDLPLVRDLDEVVFPAPVTFFVGENGSGKSTILEAVAAAVGSVAIGAEDIARDETLAPARRLAAHLTLSWDRRTHRGFFLRAEDLVNHARRTDRAMREYDELAVEFAREKRGDWERAVGLARGQQAALAARYGADPDARSHGESFLHIFAERFVPGGLYLLDEPDTALSPQRQLALLALLKDMVAQEAQFLIATHSPILLAFPGAAILAFDGRTIAEVAYDEVENVRLTRAFLADPEAYLRRL
jgi:predicted ATPase